MRPVDLKYTETHEWVKIDGHNATIGITDYAVKKLSDLVHVELPEVGQALEQDTPFGEIESVKAVSDLVAPLSGEVTAVNGEVSGNIDVLGEDPFEEGWLIKMHLDDPEELQHLLTAKEYEELIEAEEDEDDEEEEESSEEEEE